MARRIYGAGMRYTVIYRANQGQIRDPDLIYPGQQFALPTPQTASDPQ
ncbi:MAG: LysM peptidoglycan-binding domain-containing protein [Sphingomonadales bacterium]